MNLHEDKEYSLWILLLQTSNTIYRAREKEVRPYGITVEQVGVLITILYLGKHATISAISKALIRRPNSVSEILHRMEVIGLVRKKKPGKNQKSARFVLTPKGEEIYSNVAECESIHKAMSVLPVDKLDQFELWLREIRQAALKDISSEMTPPWP